ncbi:hypothetical protein [Ureibacillus sinduriensis]|uniref:Tissue inhibitor of metalloproteinase n=1 Tax=Ureibacillus sinduriensis BLB-1 = JCM 15800 TaxID=1384057 RepID=A0A0A3IHA6_9BACL|nr:hypothetical protein [Ureibacillus sinduriensis]KGR74207.1 hypothetical protein CD33_19675 [Ureibacillus sinduriensis BLB-1 = JCM 15800]
MKLKLLIGFLFIFPLVLHFQSNSSSACSCVEPGSAVEELVESDFVFLGEVININDPDRNAIFKSSTNLLEIKFVVLDIWKGVNESEVLLYTEWDSASCGFQFSMDTQYLVYGTSLDGKKSVNLCSNTANLAQASDDLLELGEGKKPSGVMNLGAEDEPSMDILISIFSVVVLLIIIASYLLVIRFNRR